MATLLLMPRLPAAVVRSVAQAAAQRSERSRPAFCSVKVKPSAVLGPGGESGK